MAKERTNMFTAAAGKRQKEQEQIEATVTGAKEGKIVRKRGENATKITLSISGEDRIRLRTYAASQGVSASDLLHEWITKYCRQEGE